MSTAFQSIDVAILVNNAANEGLIAEHGLALWIELPERRVLLDTGQGRALGSNAASLGIPLGSVDALILSHGHYDHTGGVSTLLGAAPAVVVHAHPGVTETPRYSVAGGSARDIGMPAAVRASLAGLCPERRCFTAEPHEIFPAVGLTGAIPRLTVYEDTGGPFYLDERAHRRDPLEDDTALWLRTERGLVILTGCGHAGLINTVLRARSVSGEPKVHAIFGGFHLRAASEARLERTLEALLEIAPDIVVPCHCTGEHAVHQLRMKLGERVLPSAAGLSYTLGLASAPSVRELRARTTEA